MPLILQMPDALEARLRAQAARDGIDPGALVVRTLEERLAPADLDSIALREAELLLQISEGPSEEIWREYRELSTKRDEETLSPQEHQRLIRLSDIIEASDVRRLEQMVELAGLRKVNLQTLRTQLGIPAQDTDA